MSCGARPRAGPRSCHCGRVDLLGSGGWLFLLSVDWSVLNTAVSEVEAGWPPMYHHPPRNSVLSALWGARLACSIGSGCIRLPASSCRGRGTQLVGLRPSSMEVVVWGQWALGSEDPDDPLLGLSPCHLPSCQVKTA